jgi:adenine C2-methylase RlmN of 23S rRNA A2503 and tRNA A37
MITAQRKKCIDGKEYTKEEYIAAVAENVIKLELEEAGFDYAVAIATKAEVEAGAACGQLAIINE